MDFLRTRVVTMDFDAGTVSFGLVAAPEVKTNSWKVPLSVYNVRHFTVRAVLNDQVQLDVLLDSADSSSISLNSADWRKLFPFEKDAAIQNVLIAGIGLASTVTESRVARVRSLEVGSTKYANLLCPLSPYATTPSGLGIGFLRRHSITLDFPNRTLYLRAGKRFHLEEEHDMSGLHLLRQDGLTIVHSVDERSPAALAGSKPGDSILFINSKNASTIAMKAVRQMLRAKAGEKVSLILERNQKKLELAFLLKKLM
jgi:hypothetical protein